MIHAAVYNCFLFFLFCLNNMLKDAAVGMKCIQREVHVTVLNLSSWLRTQTREVKNKRDVSIETQLIFVYVCVYSCRIHGYRWWSPALEQNHTPQMLLTIYVGVYTYGYYTPQTSLIPQTSHTLISFTDSDCATFEKSEWACWLETALTYINPPREIDSGFGSCLTSCVYHGKPETASLRDFACKVAFL